MYEPGYYIASTKHGNKPDCVVYVYKNYYGDLKVKYFGTTSEDTLEEFHKAFKLFSKIEME
jgi:hypothetical protein